MKSFKKIFALAMIITLAVGLAACGSPKVGKNSAKDAKVEIASIDPNIKEFTKEESIDLWHLADYQTSGDLTNITISQAPKDDKFYDSLSKDELQKSIKEALEKQGFKDLNVDVKDFKKEPVKDYSAVISTIEYKINDKTLRQKQVALDSTKTWIITFSDISPDGKWMKKYGADFEKNLKLTNQKIGKSEEKK